MWKTEKTIPKSKLNFNQKQYSSLYIIFQSKETFHKQIPFKIFKPNRTLNSNINQSLKDKNHLTAIQIMSKIKESNTRNLYINIYLLALTQKTAVWSLARKMRNEVSK